MWLRSLFECLSVLMVFLKVGMDCIIVMWVIFVSCLVNFVLNVGR